MSGITRWLNWKTIQPPKTVNSHETEPTKPAKDHFAGFDGSILEKPSVIRGDEASPPAPASDCQYDWIPGYRGIRLRCIAHKHCHGGNIVFRANFRGYDTLADMLKLGLLAGQGLADAQRANERPFKGERLNARRGYGKTPFNPKASRPEG